MKRRRRLRGGKARRRDRRFGISDSAFWRWWHRVGKRHYGNRDLTSTEEARVAFNEWVALGKPKVK